MRCTGCGFDIDCTPGLCQDDQICCSDHTTPQFLFMVVSGTGTTANIFECGHPSDVLEQKNYCEQRTGRQGDARTYGYRLASVGHMGMRHTRQEAERGRESHITRSAMDSFAEVQSGHQGKLMAVTDVATWIDEFSRPNTVWFAKRLTGNDTLANKTHLAGPYIPKDFLFRVFPQLNHPMDENPDHRFDLYVDSHADHRNVRVVWYNNRVRINPVTKQPYGTRNETRITGFGGQQSALLDTESTGAIAVFVFVLDKTGARSECHVWVCDNELEEDIVEARIGPVEPKHFSVWAPGTGGGLYSGTETSQSPCRLTPAQIPTEWLAKFPTGEEIIRKTRELSTG